MNAGFKRTFWNSSSNSRSRSGSSGLILLLLSALSASSSSEEREKIGPGSRMALYYCLFNIGVFGLPNACISNHSPFSAKKKNDPEKFLKFWKCNFLKLLHPFKSMILIFTLELLLQKFSEQHFVPGNFGKSSIIFCDFWKLLWET